MKKFLCLISALFLLITSLSACEFKCDSEKFDIWDGTAASCFSGGDGSKSSPYQISSCAELSYLAKEVNNGNSFEDNHFLLTKDLNLNNLEWTPIGNGSNHFSGTFDGAEHTISNLRMTKQSVYEQNNSDILSTKCTIGLFGSCINSTLKNITIDGADIIIQDLTQCTTVLSGILVGDLSAKEKSQILNIKVYNAKMTSKLTPESKTVSLLMGGISGRLNNDFSTVVADRLQTDITVSINGSRAHNTSIGGLFGGLENYSSPDLFCIKNCVSDISICVDTENCYTYGNSFGAIGHSSGRFSLSNIFSNVKINKIYDEFHGYPAYTANAVIGKVYIGSTYKDNLTDKYKFKNLFGCVEQTDGETGKQAISTQLYDIPEKWGDVVAEENCLGCTSLPKDHGFSPDIWDLGDLSDPKLK